jgi:hypothetical protein
MLQARSSGQSIEMRRSADYLGVLGRSMSGQNPLPAVAKQTTEGIADVRATHRLDVHPTFLLGKNARPQQFGPPDASCYDLDKGRGQLLDAWGERVLQATLR